MKVLNLKKVDKGWSAEIEFPEKKREGKEKFNIVEIIFYPEIRDEYSTDAMLGTAKNIGNISISGFEVNMPKTEPIMQEHSLAFAQVYRTPESKIIQDWRKNKSDPPVFNERGHEIWMRMDGHYPYPAPPELKKRLASLQKIEFKSPEDIDNIKATVAEIKLARGEKIPLEKFYPKEYVLSLVNGEKKWIPKIVVEAQNESKKSIRQSIENGFALALKWAIQEAKGAVEISQVFKDFSIPLTQKKENKPEYEVIELVAQGAIMSYSERSSTPKHREMSERFSQKVSWGDHIQKLLKQGKLSNIQLAIAKYYGFV